MKTQTQFDQYRKERDRGERIKHALTAIVFGVSGLLVCVSLNAPALPFLLCSLWTFAAVAVALFTLAQLKFSNK